MYLVDRANANDSTFTTQELERLAWYRAAVAAGFYSDGDGSAETTDTDVLVSVPVEAVAKPTPEEAAQPGA